MKKRIPNFLITFCCPTSNIDQSYYKALKILNFKDSIIKKVWKIFNQIIDNTSQNDDHNPTISFIAFTEYFNLDYSHPFVIRCFTCFDVNGGGDIDFLEFMLSVWNICRIQSDTLIKFTFNIYDTNSDGKLSNLEMKDMIREFYGSVGSNPLAESCLQTLMETSEYQGGVIDVVDFKEYAINHQMLLFPVFQLQHKIQSRIMGIKYWERQHRYENSRYYNFKKNKLLYDPSRLPALLQAYKIGGTSALIALAHDLAESDTK